MARFSVAHTDNKDQTIADINWEEESYQQDIHAVSIREQATQLTSSTRRVTCDRAVWISQSHRSPSIRPSRQSSLRRCGQNQR